MKTKMKKCNRMAFFGTKTTHVAGVMPGGVFWIKYEDTQHYTD